MQGEVTQKVIEKVIIVNIKTSYGKLNSGITLVIDKQMQSLYSRIQPMSADYRECV